CPPSLKRSIRALSADESMPKHVFAIAPAGPFAPTACLLDLSPIDFLLRGLLRFSSHPREQECPMPAAPLKKPNILFIMSDDIGWFNVSAYNMGIMGYRTPNIDRIGKEGAVFTDFYGQQSCTAGRAAFITGQSPIRTGLTKVGLPGAKLGLGADDPSVGQFMKNFGYATGQFGKNHLGDRNEHLPTVHGFDEFFGNLYH